MIISMALVILMRVKTKKYGLHIIAFYMSAFGIICMGIDTTIKIYQNSSVLLGWSLIMIIVIVPVALFFIILHVKPEYRHVLRKKLHF